MLHFSDNVFRHEVFPLSTCKSIGLEQQFALFFILLTLTTLVSMWCAIHSTSLVNDIFTCYQLVTMLSQLMSTMKIHLGSEKQSLLVVALSLSVVSKIKSQESPCQTAMLFWSFIASTHNLLYLCLIHSSFSAEQQTAERNDNLTSLKMHRDSGASEASISK